MPDTLRVFLVDDHELFLSGVRAELEGHLEVAGAASEVHAAIELIREREPDVVLVDVHMPGGGGARVIREVLASHPHVRFLALSVSDTPVDVIATIRAGARGYVTKSIAPTELREAILRVAAGDAVFSPLLAGFVLDRCLMIPSAVAGDRRLAQCRDFRRKPHPVVQDFGSASRARAPQRRACSIAPAISARAMPWCR